MVCGSGSLGPTATPRVSERKAHTREWKFYMVWLRFSGPVRILRSLTSSLPDVRNRCRTAVIRGQRLQTKVVFNRTQHVVMRVELAEGLRILLVRRFHHVAQKQRIDPIVG